MTTAPGDRRLNSQVEANFNLARGTYERNRDTAPAKLSQDQLISRAKTLKEYPRHPLEGKKRLPYQFVPSYLPGHTYSSTTSWRDLTPISAEELECPKRHNGRVLFCRILTKPVIMMGVTFATEDPAGLTVNVTIQQVTPHLISKLPESVIETIYAPGTMLAIKEPTMKFVLKGPPAVRVEVVSDVERIHPLCPDLPQLHWAYKPVKADLRTAVQIKESGNKAVAKSQYLLAVHEYSYALTCPPEQLDDKLRFILLSNRALANVKLGRPASAYRDCLDAEELADKAEATKDQYTRLGWRKALAAYDLRLWETAKEYTMKSLEAGVVEARPMLDKIANRLAEQVLGHTAYDWKSMFVDYTSGSILDVADYWGPIEVRGSTVRQVQGVFLKADVKAGDLLFVETAFMHAAPSEIRKTSLNQFDFSTGHAARGTQVLAIHKTVHRLIDAPGDIVMLRAAQNAKASPDASLRFSEEERLAMATQRDPVNIDLSEIQEISEMSHHMHPLAPNGYDPNASTDDEEARQTSLFPLGSSMCHQCMPNVYVSVWGNVMIVRALHDLPKDSELFSCATSGAAAYDERTVRLSLRGIVCRCDLCVADASEDHRKRAQILETELPTMFAKLTHISAMYPLGGGGQARVTALREAKRLLSRVEQTYTPGRRMRPDLHSIHRLLSELQMRDNPSQAIEHEIKAFESEGGVRATPTERKQTGRTMKQIGPDRDAACIVMIQLATVLHSVGRSEEAAAWLRTAHWTHDISMAGGAWLFKRRFGQFIPGGIKWQ